MDVILEAETGRTTGSRDASRLRKAGRIPAVVYGKGEPATLLSVDWPDLRKALTTEAGTNAVLRLRYGGNETLAMVRELQRHPVRWDVLHVDFVSIDRNVEIEVEVPIVLTGEAEEVSRAGGLVDQSLYHLAIYALPGAIPNELEVDISGLEVGSTLTVADITLPDGVRTEVEDDEPVASGQITRAAEEAEAEEAAEGEEGEGEAAADGEGGDDAADADEG
ncbi:MAG: 50S ribosomal protein L25 [Actinomycetota bacterium]|nr:50S ribosomal protein L25 [Actinomycetota bacterium]